MNNKLSNSKKKKFKKSQFSSLYNKRKSERGQSWDGRPGLI